MPIRSSSFIRPLYFISVVISLLYLSACDDSPSASLELDLSMSESDSDSTPQDMGPLDADLIEGDAFIGDAMMDRVERPASFSSCQASRTLDLSAEEGEATLDADSAIARLSWSTSTLSQLTLSGEGSVEEAESVENWPLVELSCEPELSSPNEVIAVSQVVSLSPQIENEDLYWRWRRPALLQFVIPEEIDEDFIQRDELELWWWPLLAKETLDRDNARSFGDPIRLMVRDGHWSPEARALTVSIDEWGAYALMVKSEPIPPSNETPHYRALIGVSMGGGASAQIGARNPELFDFVAALGGASDWIYILHYVTDRLLSGFCTGDRRGEFCGTGPVTEPMEQYADFLNMIYTDNGADFNRNFYVKVFQDVVFGLGNATNYNPNSPYLPAGIPVDELLKSKRERCQAECRGEDCTPPTEWLKLSQYYDREFNPDGAAPVIPVCDGDVGEGDNASWDDGYHETPTDLLLAVDYNNNGRRDRDEPIIINSAEPFEDVGCDGVSDLEEPGYHPLLNPDPSGDNFHWLYRPFGTEGDRLYQGANGAIGLEDIDTLPRSVFNLERNPISSVRGFLQRFACQGQEPGEPFSDHGLDGIPLTLSVAEGGYDWGEGNGTFDYNPHKINFITMNPSFWLAEALQNPSGPRFWIDGGIRDAMNFVVASMHLAGRLHGLSVRPVTLYDSFESLLGTEVFIPRSADPGPVTDVGHHVLLRYGDPDATPEEIEAGDGAHVGTNQQAVGRVNGPLHWIMSDWSQRLGEQPRTGFSAPQVLSDYVDSERFGGRYHFEVALPPGYDDEDNQNRRYPVVFFQHGYGQRARYLTSSSLIFNGLMSSGIWPPTIFIYPDGACSDMIFRACNDETDNDGDGLVDLDDPGCRDNERRRTEEDDPEDDRPDRCADGVDNDRDGLVDLDDPGCLSADHDNEGECREGTFYLPHIVSVDGVSRGRDYEGAFLDMIHDIDQKYRTLATQD